MRDTFVRTLIGLAKEDPSIELVTADLGFGVLKPFWEQLPDQFTNCGIAEQNMTALAAGMALSGKTVFTYSIGNFPTLRCLEQIRNDAAYHNANVKIVCIGGGFVYGSLGMSHQATEDLAVMRALPGVTVLAPGDLVEAEAAQRGWISASAKDLYEAGIKASFDWWEASGADEYVASEGVAFDASKAIEQIALQRWIAGYLADGIEAWSDWRRLDIPKMPVGPAAADQGTTHYPFRLPLSLEPTQRETRPKGRVSFYSTSKVNS